ncbi:MAG: GW dipeptide domain-containing protein [Flavobacteriaceae bacterium]
MKFLSLKHLSLVSASLCLLGCNNGPKVIQAENPSENNNSGIFSGDNTPSNNSMSNTNSGSFTDDLHRVVVNEVIPATKYSYLSVTEGGKVFWIAIRKHPIEKGASYFYKGGLLKTNFESKEHNRVFDTIYLVSKIVPENHGGNSNTMLDDLPEMNTVTEASNETTMLSEKVTLKKGSIPIADIVKNPKKYEGKTVQVTGICTKINPNIMNRNWIHLKDGSRDDYDFVITSDTFIPEGHTVTFQAVVALNKDFGAGYTYNLILEEGVVVP